MAFSEAARSLPPRGGFFWLLLLTCLLLPLAQGIDCKPGCHPTNGFCVIPNECRCNHGWQGAFCNQCIAFPGCMHGTCTKPWECTCEEGWIGSRCDKDSHPCSSKPCANNAINCIETSNGEYICVCAQGYTGKNCHVKKAPCTTHGSPCQNGGICIDGDGFAAHASCHCLPGFTGNFCELDLDECELNPCENGGTCMNTANGFSCHCLSGYNDILCRDRVTACASNPCKNGGTCHALSEGGFQCLCRPHFEGVTCASSSRNARPDREAHHQPLHSQKREILTIKETVENRVAFLSKSQVICFIVLGLLTCLVVLGTTGIIFFSKFKIWLANARYTQLVRKERDSSMKARDGESPPVKIIFPDQSVA